MCFHQPFCMHWLERKADKINCCILLIPSVKKKKKTIGRLVSTLEALLDFSRISHFYKMISLIEFYLTFFTWLSLVVSLMASFVLSFFPLDVLDEIWDLIESVSEGFLTYSTIKRNSVRQGFFFIFVWSDSVIKLVSVLSGKCTTLVITKC